MTTVEEKLFDKILKAKKRKTYQLESDFKLLLQQIQASREKIRVSKRTDETIIRLHGNLRIMEKRIDKLLQYINKRDTEEDDNDYPLPILDDLTRIDPDGMSNIWEAAVRGSFPGVKFYLFEDPSKLNMPSLDEANITPIQHAVVEGQQHIVHFLLLIGADSDPTSCENTSPLQEACLQGNRHIVKLLLDYGANPNHQNFNNWTPLHYAVDGNHLDVVELLIENGADKDIQNLDLRSPVDMARQYMDRPSLVHYMTLF